MPEEKALQTQKRKPHPKALKNLRPDPTALPHKGRPVAPLQPHEIEFCCYKARGFIVRDCARYVGLTYPQGRSLLLRESIKVEIEAQREKVRKEVEAKAEQTIAGLRQFVVEDYKHIARTLKSEPQKVKHNRNGFEAVGLVQAEGRVQVNNQANAVAAPRTAIDVYESEWMQEQRTKMAKQLEVKYGLHDDTATTPNEQTGS